MNTTMVIASREFRSLFLSPIAWIILAVMQFIMAFLFLSQVETFALLQPKLATIIGGPGLTDIVITPLFGNAAIILLLVTPLLTMRVICEERRNKTLALLLSAPISNKAIIGGKYLGILGLLAVIVFLITLMPLSLLVGGELDFGKLAANIIALLLLVMSYTAIGVFMSCIAGHPTTAAITTFGSLLLLWILDWTAGMDSQYSEVFQYLSMLKHFQAIQSGLMSSVDMAYFVLFILAFMTLSVRRLDNDRLQK